MDGQSVEDVAKRTAYAKTFRNPDGTFTARISPAPQHYWTGSGWADIDNELVADPDGGFRNRANSFTARFGLGASGVRLETPQGTISMVPVGAALTAPIVEAGGDTVTYPQVWPGIDVRYRVENTGIKEEIVLRRRSSVSRFSFRVQGTSLTPRSDGSLATAGAFGGKWEVAPPVVFAKDGNTVPAAAPGFSVTGETVTLAVDGPWLASLDPADFPVVLDPSYHSVGAQTSRAYQRNATNDGYTTCEHPCQVHVGNPNDPAGWRTWRSVVYYPYENLYGKQILSGTSTVLLLQVREDGTPNTSNIKVYGGDVNGTYGGDWDWIHLGAYLGEAPAGNSWSFDGASLAAYYQDLVDRRLPGMPVKYVGDETVNTYTYKRFAWFQLQLTYNDPPTIAQPVVPPSPANGSQVHAPTLKASSSDPNGDPISYWFRVCTGSDAESGLCQNSGWITSDQWSPPGLSVGTTYYWHVYSHDGYLQTNPNWVWSFTPTNTAPNPDQLYPEDGYFSRSPYTLSALYGDPDGDAGKVEFELSGYGIYSKDVANGATAYCDPGSCLPTLGPGIYSWRARAVDNYGAASNWTEWRGGEIEKSTLALRDEWTVSGGYASTWSTTNWATSSSGLTRTVDIDNYRGRMEVKTSTARATAQTPDLADVDLTLTYAFNDRSTDGDLRLTLRGSGATGNNQMPDGYRLDIDADSTTVKLKRVVAGIASTIGSFTYNYATATESHRVRFRVVGSTIQVRMWKAGTPEPAATWNLQLTNTAVTKPGKVQITHYYAGFARTLYVDNATVTQEILWGVDSTTAMNAMVNDAANPDDPTKRKTLLQNVRDNWGGDPEVWGRYLHDKRLDGTSSGNNFGLTSDEIQFDRDTAKVPILVIDSNPGPATDGIPDNLKGYANGQAYAKLAVDEARRLSIPTSVAIFADIEDQVDSEWIKGWFDAITAPPQGGAGYKVGYYADPQDEPFKTAYCTAIGQNARIGNESTLWAFRPLTGRTTKTSPPAYNPNRPACGPTTTVLAYQYGHPPTPQNPDPNDPFPRDGSIDTDLYTPELLASDLLWRPYPPCTMCR